MLKATLHAALYAVMELLSMERDAMMTTRHQVMGNVNIKIILIIDVLKAARLRQDGNAN